MPLLEMIRHIYRDIREIEIVLVSFVTGSFEGETYQVMAARSHSPDPLTAAFRSTQRPPKSCTQCTRRKVRCSKTIPCRQCIHRKLEQLCSREVVNVNGKITMYEA